MELSMVSVDPWDNENTGKPDDEDAAPLALPFSQETHRHHSPQAA